MHVYFTPNWIIRLEFTLKINILIEFALQSVNSNDMPYNVKVNNVNIILKFIIIISPSQLLEHRPSLWIFHKKNEP
jgi:hypothetical protein